VGWALPWEIGRIREEGTRQWLVEMARIAVGDIFCRAVEAGGIGRAK
jgi:hypothetical protein